MVATDKQIDDVLAAFARAAEANLATPSREGSVVALSRDNADEVMVVGDLHGHRENFEAALAVADLEAHPRRHLVLQEVCHGGPAYLSGGCQSHRMLEDVARLKARLPERVHFLLSNHELSELIDYPICKGRKVLNLMFRMGLHAAYGDAAERVRDAYLPFLESCPLAVRTAGGAFISHSLPERLDEEAFDAGLFSRRPRPTELKPGGDAFRLVWGRDFRRENAETFARLTGARLLVHGHEPCTEGYAAPNRWQVIIDSSNDAGCYVILPVAKAVSQKSMLSRIRRLI